jgi:hypothetical protein
MKTHLEPGIQPTKPAGNLTMPSLSALQSDQGSASNVECSHRERLPASDTSSAASIPQYLPPALYSEQDILISLSDFVARIERSANARALSSTNISARKLIEYEKPKVAHFNVFDNAQEIPTEILAPKLEEFMAWFRLSHEVSSQAAAIERKKANRKLTLFPKLPIELREMVWGEALPGPRVVELFNDPEKIFYDPQKTVFHA